MGDDTVLVIEDDAMNLELVQDLLTLAGFEVLTATTAREGIERARAHHPALVLIDVDLPDMSGFDATRELKGDPETREIGVVALTAHAMPTDRQQAFAAGCCGFLAKPIATRTFAAEVRALLPPQRGG